MNEKHTQGPWRWEVNEKGRTMHLVGGVPQYDLTIIDFERWGLGGAIMRLRDTSLDGMNLMSRCTAWAKVVVGREHHADWFKDIDHPDARLISAAPDLLAALELPFKYEKVFNEGGGKASDELLKTYGWDERCSPETFMQEVARAAISKATGA